MGSHNICEFISMWGTNPHKLHMEVWIFILYSCVVVGNQSNLQQEVSVSGLTRLPLIALLLSPEHKPDPRGNMHVRREKAFIWRVMTIMAFRSEDSRMPYRGFQQDAAFHCSHFAATIPLIQPANARSFLVVSINTCTSCLLLFKKQNQ